MVEQSGERIAPPPVAPNPDLSRTEHEQIERRTAPRAAVVYETIRRGGEEELRRPVVALAWSGLAAGLSMGFSMVSDGLLRAGLPDAPWSHLISSLGYSVGFLIVILGRQQLFTENTLTPILPLLAQPSLERLGRVARLWAVVLAANLAGAFIFAFVVATMPVFEPEVLTKFDDLASELVSYSFGTTMLRGVFAGWLIALMVWLLPFAETARVLVIVIITYVVGLGRFAHVIVGSVEVLYGVITGSVTLGAYLGSFLLPGLLGNIIGGVALVALLNYGQVRPSSSGRAAS
jgi:formate-nitrite transporter family protein